MANEYLRRNFTSTGNLKVGTFSFWMKGRPYDTNQTRPVYLYDGSNLFQMFFERTSGTNPGQIILYGAGADIRYKGVYRDPSAWSHYLVKVDNTINGAEARFEVYANGVRLEIVGSQSGSTASYPTRDANIFNNVFYINGTGNGAFQCCDYFFVDGQALTPDVFGFYKQGKGYISAGSTQATDFRPGQWVPKTPRVIKTEINRRGGFGVNGFYLPMNDSRNFGADFHGDPNSIITLNERLPQPRVGVATTASVGLGYTDALRSDPYAANLVLAVPGVIGGRGSGYGDYSADIKGSGSNKTITANGNAGVAVTASYYGSALSFDGSGDYFASANSSDFYFNGDFTVEFWVYRNVTSTSETLVGVFENSVARRSWQIETRTNSALRFEWFSDGSSSSNITTANNSVPGSQWNHIAMVKKNNTITGYVNGVAAGITTTAGAIYQNTVDPLRIGVLNAAEDQDFNGYIQDLRIYKGVAKYTGGFDVPRPYTPVGIATWRAVPDTTANNFATLNAVDARSNSVTFADGNLSFTGATSNQSRSASTIGITTGKYYYEARLNTTGGTYPAVGVCGIVTSVHDTFVGQDAGSFGYYSNGGVNGTGGNGGTYSTYTTGDIIGIAINLTDSQLTFYKNGSNAVTSGTTYEPLTSGNGYRAAVSCFNTGKWNVNFGQNPTLSGNTTAGTFTDSNGKGLFKYQPPSGFLALCEDNLPTPAISNPGQYFKTVLYTGDGNNGRSIVGVGFTPDLVWIKSRTVARNHRLQDSVRGFTNVLSSDLTSAEYGTGDISSANNDGFSLLARDNQNISAESYVAWCWRAGAGTTSTNTNGSITSVVSVNQDAGFSIVSYTGNGSNPTTVGHGLTKAPKFIIFKCRNAAVNWFVYHGSMGPSGIFEGLNTNSAYSASAAAVFNNTAPSSSVITLGGVDANTNGRTYIAYCWAEIEGFSKFGSYVGNGSADGPFVYCGFKPAFVMIKRADSADHWTMFDSSRDSANNDNNLVLYANLTNGDSADAVGVDKLSNGFKIRNTTGGRYNASNGTYIFAAFAESPFTTANAK